MPTTVLQPLTALLRVRDQARYTSLSCSSGTATWRMHAHTSLQSCTEAQQQRRAVNEEKDYTVLPSVITNVTNENVFRMRMCFRWLLRQGRRTCASPPPGNWPGCFHEAAQNFWVW